VSQVADLGTALFAKSESNAAKQGPFLEPCRVEIHQRATHLEVDKLTVDLDRIAGQSSC